MKMKNIRYLLLVFVLALSACEDDAEIIEAIDERDQISKEWRVEEDSDIHGLQIFKVSISKHASSQDSIIISNFSALGSEATVTAYISGKSILIPNQKITGEDKIVSGQGTIANGYQSIDMLYTIDGDSYNADLLPDGAIAKHGQKQTVQ